MHIPVLQKEVISLIKPQPNENFVDCTIGGAGHTLAILNETAPNGVVLGIDWSPEMIENLKLKIGNIKDRLILVCGNFSDLRKIVEENGFYSVQGILFDIGVSSWHLDKLTKGFSFQRDELLDMRYNSDSNVLTAEEIVNKWPEEEIEKILKNYGQERFSKKIVRNIIKMRSINPIKTTFQLKEIITRSIPKRFRHSRIHCATRTFQALRIAVNNELNNLENALPQALEILDTGGRLAVISFHSLEDRIVKNFFKEYSKKGRLKILTKKPVLPRSEEIKFNPRSRSAKLRVAIKI